jgi:hypothetical protein
MFEMLALRQQSSGTIHVYAHSEHNHPIMPEGTRYFWEHLIFYFKNNLEKRAISRRAKELMPAANPPRIFHTEDKIEWAFVQTFADYDSNFDAKATAHSKQGEKTIGGFVIHASTESGTIANSSCWH